MKDSHLSSVVNALPEQVESNPIRGAKYKDNAIEFAKKWPIGTSLTWKEFCEWAHSKNLLPTTQPDLHLIEAGIKAENEKRMKLGKDPEDSSPRRSNAWLAHLQRRHQARMNLNKAAQHSSMIECNPGGAFSIESIGGVLMVKDVAKVMAEGTAAKRIKSLANTKRKQLEYLFQSTDWAQLPPHERAIAESLKDDIDDWVSIIDLQAKQHEAKFAKLQSRLSSLVAIGDIMPQNGGIMKLLESEE